MQIKVQPMGDYQTNCYIVTINDKDLIIDPGMNATSWVLENTNNPIAILNTHGHFDHVWSNAQLKEKLNIPIYCPKDDAFMLQNDPFEQGTPSSIPDHLIEPDQTIILANTKITFHFFSGHTPGCSAISINNHLFSGDFIFANTIGRFDFPYSNANDMKSSIKKILTWNDDYIIHPGHGLDTTLANEKPNLIQWLDRI